MVESNIVPECYVDTRIAEILGQAKGKYNHQHSNGAVANELQRRFKERVVLGIVDEDKGKGAVPKYFSEFIIIAEENNLILKKHKDRNQYLILICPEIERWLLADSERVGINPSELEYKLPDKLANLTKMTKTKDIDRNEGFKKFIKALVRENAPSTTTLKNWIELFKIDQLDSLSNK
jgi:hypothetical protein